VVGEGDLASEAVRNHARDGQREGRLEREQIARAGVDVVRRNEAARLAV
jgi:hypothetical protein